MNNFFCCLILQKYNFEKVEDENLETIAKRIKAVLSNIRYIAKQVLKCVLNQDDEFEPNILGMTPFAAYVSII